MLKAATPDVFHAIADPNRRRLLDLLAEGESPAQQLAGRFTISFAAVSQHLKVLREAGLVASRPAGRRRVYRLPLRTVDQWTSRYQRFWQDRLQRLGNYLDETK
jgi:DNA-binding transcriptional ArsR family regulator